MNKICHTNELRNVIYCCIYVIGTTVRQWCGDSSDPPGIFLSALISVNPFRNVPILKDWLIENTHVLYAFITSDPSSKLHQDIKIDIADDILELDKMVTRFKDPVQSTLKSDASLLSSAAKEVLQNLHDVIDEFQTSISNNMYIIKEGNYERLADILAKMWKHFTKIESKATEFIDTLEHYITETEDIFITFIKQETANIKQNIYTAIQNLKSQVSSAIKDYSGFGLKYRTTIVVFGLKFLGIDIEFVSSANALMGCTRFEKVKRLLQGEKALRFLGRTSKGINLGYFLKADFGVGVGGAFGADSSNVMLQINVFIDILGIKATGDLFISQKGLYLYLEGNIWGLFLAQVDISAEVGKQWHELTFDLKGRFVAKTKRKRQTQTNISSYQDSYLDALKKATRIISNEANTRLSQAQNALSEAQMGLSVAQDWLDDKKAEVQNANKAFDDSVASLEKAKTILEEAKGPFQRALDKLKKAQKDVDNLCRIRTCKKVCIPGLKCKLCSKKIGWVRITYPCCRLANCMISFPNPLCVAANLICRGIRAIAYTALEAAKIFVKAPMLALDVAKTAVSVAQVIVDKSRVVLTLAELVFDVAKLGLEAAKGSLELAKQSLEAVKIVVGAAANVLEFVIEFGLKNILDVRNCGFSIQISTSDLPVFDVFCEVNAFNLGWKTIQMRINFKNIFQSIWQAAKATINAIIKGFGDLIKGRRRRDVSFDASMRMHVLLRKVRQSDQDCLNATVSNCNETLNIINITKGFSSLVLKDYDNRVLLFKQKCVTMTTIQSFLQDMAESLLDIANETKSLTEKVKELSDHLITYDLNQLANNMTLESADINIENAFSDYNLTQNDLKKALENAKHAFYTDPLLQELSSTAAFSKGLIKTEMESIESSPILTSWLLAMENVSKDFFDDTVCVNFRDCIFYAVSELYDLYQEDNHPNISEIKDAIMNLEDSLLNVLQNTSQTIQKVYNISVSISSNLRLLSDLNVFCSEPPRFLYPMVNVTVVRGHTASIKCHVTADPSPAYWWYRNEERMEEERSSILIIVNATEDDEAKYQCMGGNVVANITSNAAYLHVVEEKKGNMFRIKIIIKYVGIQMFLLNINSVSYVGI